MQTTAETPAACAAGCLAVGLARCLSFTWYTDTTDSDKAQQCRFYDRRAGPSFITTHQNKDYYVLISNKCFNDDGLSIASVGDEDTSDAENELELEDYSWMDHVDEPSSDFPLRTVARQHHPKRKSTTNKFSSQGEPRGPSEEPSEETTVLVPIIGAVTMVVIMSMYAYAIKRVRTETHAFKATHEGDELSEPRPTSSSDAAKGGNLHNAGTGVVELVWEAATMEDCSTALSRLVSDVSLVQGGALSPEILARSGFVVCPTASEAYDDSDSSSSEEEYVADGVYDTL